jgi:bifunctional UDP-N-acetylglucosamine pyrophosphorylase/glucosamine-1-phosphate N-acetyltransferase
MSERRELPGVRILDPARVWIEPEVEVGAESVLYPDVALLGRTVIGRGCTLHQGAWLRDTRLGDGVVVEPYSVLDGAVVGDGCRVGPFARLRPGTVLERNVRVGNFVEVKQSRLGEGAKANHLAYLGDAQVGAGANIGAGVVTCNYDGVDKHPTTIGRDAFVGSDTMLVAPVRIGDEATTAAGSVITQDVEDGALAVGRSKQRNIPGWAARRTKVRKKKKES